MRIAIYGAGAVGAYFGGRLAQAGAEVIFIARGEQLAALQAQGLRVTSIAGDFVVQPAQATADPATVGPVDLVIVAVKTWQVPAVAEAMRPLMGPDTVVLPLQNGVEAPGQLATALGKQHVLGGSCVIIAAMVEPGHIRHVGANPAIRMGELDNVRTARIENIQHSFAQAQGMTAEIVGDINVALWQKFLLIASWSGVGAVTRAPIYTICRQPETRQMLTAAMQEIHTVALAHDIALSSTFVPETLATFENLPAGATASMQRDIMQGRPSELEAQTGAVVRLGQAAGVPTPVNNFIYQSLYLMEQKARGLLQF